MRARANICPKQCLESLYHLVIPYTQDGSLILLVGESFSSCKRTGKDSRMTLVPLRNPQPHNSSRGYTKDKGTTQTYGTKSFRNAKLPSSSPCLIKSTSSSSEIPSLSASCSRSTAAAVEDFATDRLRPLATFLFLLGMLCSTAV